MSAPHVEVLFVGGPADGRILAIPGLIGHQMVPCPPHHFEVAVAPHIGGIAPGEPPFSPNEHVPVQSFTYVFRLNPDARGPRWIGVPADPHYRESSRAERPSRYDEGDPLLRAMGLPQVPDVLPPDF